MNTLNPFVVIQSIALGSIALHRIALVAFLLIAPALTASAQEAVKPGAPPHGETTKLYMFEGAWSGKGTVFIKQDTIPVSVTMKFERTADGFGLLGRLKAAAQNADSYLETQLLTYDVAAETVRLFGVTNTGQTKSYQGAWASDETNTLKLAYIHGEVGKEYKETLTIIFGAQGQIILRNLATVNGKYHSSYEAELKK